MLYRLSTQRLRHQPWAAKWLLRAFSYENLKQSGHNRWSKIKHDKAKVDQGKTAVRTALAKEIASASRDGGPDPGLNHRLSQTIMAAKRAGFPKASITAAIDRGQGKSASGATLVPLTVEFMIPPSIAAVADYLTDSKARTLQETKEVLKQFDAILTPTSYMFERRGRIVLERHSGMEDMTILEEAIEVGAEDVEICGEDGTIEIYTEASDVKSIATALVSRLSVTVSELEIVLQPRGDNKVDVEGTKMEEQIEKLLVKLEEDQSLQNVYLNTA